MRIAALASELGVSVDWIRRLEKAGVIPKARRDKNGHRRFSADDVDRLRSFLFEEPTTDGHDKGDA